MINQTLEQKLIESLKGLKYKKIFVTGGTGFFGKSFLDVLLRFGQNIDCDILILSRNSELFLKQNSEFKSLKNVRYHTGDITNFDFIDETFDCIFHFATPADAKMNIEQPLVMSEIIVTGMKHILDFAVHAKIKKIIFASSGAAYGTQPSDLTHVPENYKGSPDTKASDAAYGESKRYSEFLGCAYAKKYNFEFKIARCFAFTGRYLNRNGSFAIANFIQNILDHKNIEIKGDGTPYRSYLYADDLIVWLLTILEHGKNCEIYNVGSDQDLNIHALANTVIKTLNSDLAVNIQTKILPNTPIARYVPNIDKAKNELGLQVYTNLETAILKTIK